MKTKTVRALVSDQDLAVLQGHSCGDFRRLVYALKSNLAIATSYPRILPLSIDRHAFFARPISVLLAGTEDHDIEQLFESQAGSPFVAMLKNTNCNAKLQNGWV